MQIAFDLAYDNGVAGNRMGVEAASIGQCFVGQLGLLQILESQLGLTGKEIHLATRIQAYMECMEQLQPSRVTTFFVESFNTDPWSSAKQILSWRDELVLAGWKGELPSPASPRLQAMAAIETHLQLFESREKIVTRGIGDRLQGVLAALQTSRRLKIATIELATSVSTLPFLLQQLFARLRACQVTLRCGQPSSLTASGNLGSLQSVMFQQAERKNVMADDDTLQLLSAEDEWEAANSVVSWLQARSLANTDVLLIRGQGSDVLDATLRRAGLPAQGNNQRSCWRGALQVLPLALANLWEPLSIHALQEFLSLPFCPLPDFAALRLRKALEREPGIGGRYWKSAEQAIEQQYDKQLRDEGVETSAVPANVQKFMAQWRRFLIGTRCNPAAGIPPNTLTELCLWLQQGRFPRLPDTEKARAQIVAQTAQMMAIAQRHNAPIPRAQVERMLDSIIGDGKPNPAAIAEASPWTQVADPGGIVATAQTIVWWNFTAPRQTRIHYWSPQERTALQDIGVTLELPATIRQREAAQGHNALRFAGRHLLLVAPRSLRGERVQPHPLWDEIRYAATAASETDPERIHQRLVIDGLALQQQPSPALAGRTPAWQRQMPVDLPRPELCIDVKPGCIPKPDKLSYSKINTFLGCPAKWVLHYHVKLRPMAALHLPTDNTLKGILCHKVIEMLIQHGQCNTDTDPGRKAGEWFDRLLPQMAAELLDSGRDLERTRFRNQVIDAAVALLGEIKRARLQIIESEISYQASLEGDIVLEGFIDLVLQDPQGREAIIDLKWSNSSRRRREELRKGHALQLACYSRLLKAASGSWAPGAYYQLVQKELLTTESGFGEAPLIACDTGTQSIWDQGWKSWKQMFNSVLSGAIEVSGLQDEKTLVQAREGDNLLYVEPACHFCDFGKLCGKTRADS